MKDQQPCPALLILPSPCITGKSSHGSNKLLAHVDFSKLRPRVRPYHARIVVLVPDFSRRDGTEGPAYVPSRLLVTTLRSRSTGFEAGQRIQFQSRSDLNWLAAMLTESVYKLELHAATVIGTTLR